MARLAPYLGNLAMSIAKAYDAIAPNYDALLHHDQWLRQILWSRYQALFAPGQHVLDLGCGTGLDTLFLAQMGVHVTAVDISPGMLAQLQQKAAALSLTGTVQTAVLDATNFATWPASTFDGLIAVFAVLNTFPNLTQFAQQAAVSLRPDSPMLLHLLNDRAWWRPGDRDTQPHPRTFRVSEQPVMHYLYAPQRLYTTYFARHFDLMRSYGLGIWHPPQLGWTMASRGLAWMERVLAGKRPFKYAGRFFVLELARRGLSAAAGAAAKS